MAETKGIIDLTKPLGNETEIFSDEEYTDPEFAINEWSSVDVHGFRVSSIRLGTQTGTHIDAPNHFDPSGECLDKLIVSELMGSYYLIDLLEYNDLASLTELCGAFSNERIIFLRAYESSVSVISKDAFDILLSLPSPVWVVGGQISIDGYDKYAFHRFLAYAGKYLVEDLDSVSASKVLPGGEIFLFPLRLNDVSGSPCRVVVRMT
ncbi:cyclase family protein [Desulforegula conservatrix]|uniref:cyclase family protein n=1 Tax=Desulforegula conservatrix TaxID=153026 RepID=UPI00041F9192|nr:cyclase family protein [Desulforegula conservatrix]